ncbi:Type III methyltransferase M.BclIV [[Bacillus] caldolyticus]|uniref:Type III methyltransferase M.BclIV n=1 Tax=Bacillus caldolyticus TaxID=1394 RepID=A0ABM6QJQ6_BACCL|nr:Type III methyltransferase M.BclIV [[Bacillus] caldolyticus]
MENRVATGGITLAQKQKLELTWIGKDEQPKLEPRILLEDPELSYHAKERVSENDIFDNRLIYGDNLLALKALEQEFTGKIKCIYIDPPYNTGAAFEYYDDSLEHSIWLTLMKQRLEILKKLLSKDGVIFVQIDDKEMAYLRILMDEIFGRRNFLNMIVVKTSDPSGHKTVNPSPYSQTEYILMYAKERSQYNYEIQYVESEYDPSYNKYIVNRNESFEKWKIVNLEDIVAKELGFNDAQEAKLKYGKLDFLEKIAEFALHNADSVFQLTAISDAAGKNIVKIRDESKKNRGVIYHIPREGYEDIYVLNGRQIYFYSSKIKEIDNKKVPAKPLTNLWTDIPWNGIANEGGVKFKNGKKPEKLIRRCIEMSTKKGDWVLDSFAGSGTTGAVAHKMGRRWIMIELGEHCHTHIIPRMKRVIDGTDQSGISKAVNWKGGGGFRYYKLAPSLLKKDKFGNWIINPEYNPEMLAEAMCKHEGFTYNPDPEVFWKQGQSTENDFIYTTTQLVTQQMVESIVEQMKENETLLICCKAYNVNVEDFPQVTIKKIPQAILNKCEFGRDDYSLNVNNLPMKEKEPEQLELF